jgi:hypothetical protein
MTNRAGRGALVAVLGVFLFPSSWAMSAQDVPDLSGVWGRNTIDYAQPEKGVGPLKNISGSRNVMVGDFNDPMLKPWAAEIVKKNGEIAKTGDAFPTAHNQCWPEPPPYILTDQQLQVLQQKDQVTLIFSHSSQVRHVRLNASHPAHVTPSWYGDSIGRYEGDTLVVDTVGIAVRPLSSLDRYGTPHTEALHVIERYHMVDQASAPAEPIRAGGFGASGGTDDVIDRTYKGKILRVDFTVEDAGAFNMPWSGYVQYQRAKGLLIEDVCAENIHDYIMNRDSKVPTATTAAITGE